MPRSPELVYAVDFGTSNSLLAATDGERVFPAITLDPASPDPSVLRSIIYTPDSGNWFFGADAVTEYGDHLAEGRLFRSLKKYLPDAAFTGTTVNGRFYNLAELIAVFLREVRRRANAHFGRDGTHLMLGRPAVFGATTGGDDLAEKRLRAAAQLAGFTSVEFCPEPVAAAYEFRHQLTEPRTVLIADFGGGTSDFTVLKMGPARFTDKDVLATHGVAIAGDRFDGVIMKHMIAPHFGTDIVYKLPLGSNELRLPTHLVDKLCSAADISFLARKDIMNLLKDAQRWSLNATDAERMNRLFLLVEEHLGYRLFKAIEHSKIELSQHAQTRFQFLHPDIEIEEDLYSADFKRFGAPLVERIVGALDETLKLAGVTPKEIDIVCCTGGTAKLPALNFELEKRFGAAALRQHRHFHSVVEGLAERALAQMA